MGAEVIVESLSVHFGSKAAVKDVSLRMPANRITAIIGPSGCGKSTLLRAINRMHDHVPGAKVTGQIRVGGQEVYASDADPVALRRQVGMVFQRPNPFPTMTIAQNILFAPRKLGLVSSSGGPELVRRCLEQAALWDEVKERLEAPATGLSGGQQQRLCIARALAVGPEVLIMDEPASALDPIATARIEDLMSELKHRYTIVVVTHNMQQASRVSDLTAFMYLGELVEFGETNQLFLRPKETRTADYISGRFG